MKRYAVIVGTKVESIVIADNPLNDGNTWVDLTGMAKEPLPQWEYIDGAFVEHEPPVVEPPPPPKTEEEKIADATAAAITKLIADGVLKPV